MVDGQGLTHQSSSDQQVGVALSIHGTDEATPVVDVLNGMSTPTYCSQLHQPIQIQGTLTETSQWEQSHHQVTTDLFSDPQQPTLNFEHWLSFGNLDDNLLRNWPFVIDDVDLECTRVDAAASGEKPVADFQHSWYTHVDKGDPAVSGYTTPLLVQRQELDDNYRQSLHRRLQIRVLDQTLPSAEFLNLCLRAYFKSFHPVFPIIHAATFRPSKTNAVLVLSMCSIGSLMTGHPRALQRGIQLFERLNKAILSNWETLICKGPDEHMALVQAALLGQSFGMLSGQAKHLVLVDTFHGTIVAWARRAKLFQKRSRQPTHQDLEGEWREWARGEERSRFALAVRIHDAEIASTLHHETMLPLVPKEMIVTHGDALFFAANPQDWKALHGDNLAHTGALTPDVSCGYATLDALHARLLSIPMYHHFSIYSALEDILSAIIEARTNETLETGYIHEIHFCLMAFRKHYRQSPSASKTEALQGGIIILWHFLFISLHADSDMLEKSIGRDGPEPNPSDLAKTREWARSADGKRTAAHAIMIKKNLEHFPLTSEPAIHVPRAMFASAICLFCYSKYGCEGKNGEQLDFPEFTLLDVHVAALLLEINKTKRSGDDELSPVHEYIDLLQRIGHWEISRKFASILRTLIQVESS